MIGVTTYLTSHYFELKFPTALQTSSICNISQFFNCDSTTFSALSNIAGIPISIFALFLGVLLLSGYLFKNESFESVLFILTGINLLGCFILFVYSLFVLKTICPFCFLYYIISFFIFFIFYKYSSYKEFKITEALIITIAFSILASVTYYYTTEKSKEMNLVKIPLIKEYTKLIFLGNPKIESKFRIASATKKFSDAPIQITKFSDFECPACKRLSDQLQTIKRKYQGSINIQYFFFPLDSECNPNMTQAFHRNACYASYLAYCLPENFEEIEHLIFKNQKKLSYDFLKAIAKKRNVLECFTSKKTKKAIQSMVTRAEPFSIQSTPTFLLNGKKIEGALPLNQIYILLDHLIKQNQ